MRTDLHSQLNDYGRYHQQAQTPVDVDEIMGPGEKVRPMPMEHPSQRRWGRGLATAVATGAIVLSAIGLVSVLLVGGEPETPSAGTDVSPTVAPTTDPNIDAEPDVDDTLPTGSTVPNVEESLEIDPNSIGLPLVAEVVTPSSIGDVIWRIFESDGEEQSFEVMRGLGAVAPTETVAETGQSLDPSLTGNEVFVVEGIAIRGDASPLANIGESYLTLWGLGFDPEGTALATNPGLFERSADGALLGYGEVTGDVIEVALYENERDADLSDHKPSAVEGEPVEIVARYRLVSTLDEDGTLLRVFDADNGDLVGSVTAGIDLNLESPLWWGFPYERRGEYYVSTVVQEPLMTLSGGGFIEHVTPPWAGADMDALVNTGEELLLYIETSEGGGYAIWRTSDLRDWTNLGPPTGWPAGYAEPQVSYQDGMFQVDLNDQIGGRPDNIFMNSPNGVDWVPVENLPLGNGRLIKVESGFAWIGAYEVEVWTSPNAADWEMIDLSDMPVPLGGLLGSGELGNVAWFHQAGDVDRLWILQFTGG